MPRGGSLYDNVESINSQYVPKFIGSNFEQLSNAQKTLEERYYRNKDYSDKLSIMAAQDQYLQNDVGIKNNLYRGLSDEIDTISKSDANFENSTAAIGSIAKNFLSDQTRIAALDNYKRAGELEQARLKDPTLLVFGDTPENFSTIDPETKKPKRFNLDYATNLDKNKKFKELVGKIAGQGYIIDPTGKKITVNDQVLQAIKTGYVNDQVTKSRVDEVVEALIPLYKQEAEGKQDQRILTELDGLKNSAIKVFERDSKGRTLNSRETTDVDESIRQRFRAAIYPQIGQQVVGRYDIVPPGTKDDGNSGLITGTSAGGRVNSDSVRPLPDFSNNENVFKKSDGTYGQFIDNRTGKPVLRSELGELLDSGGAYVSEAAEKFVKDTFTELKADVNGLTPEANASFEHITSTMSKSAEDNLIKLNGGKGYDAKTYVKAQIAATKHMVQYAPSGTNIALDQRKTYQDMIDGQLGSTSIIAEGQDGFKKVNELTKGQKYKATPARIHDVSPNSKLKGSLEVIIKPEGNDSDFAEFTAYMPLDDQYVEATSTVDHVFKNSFFAGRDTYTLQAPFEDKTSPEIRMDKKNRKVLVPILYTTTIPKPEGGYSGTEPSVDTDVTTGWRIYNITPENELGDYEDRFDNKNNAKSIQKWHGTQRPIIKQRMANIIGGGQSLNKADIKKFFNPE